MKKHSASQTSPQRTACAPQLEPPILTPRAFLLPPLPKSILLQPIRLNRASPQWAEPQTTREAVTKSRAFWKACCQLTKLTVADFRMHLAKDLQDLPLPTAESRRQLRPLFKSVPDDALFWQVVQEADCICRDYEMRLAQPLGQLPQEDDQAVWNGSYFHARFAAEQRPFLQERIQLACDVLFVIKMLRSHATGWVEQRSRLLYSSWNAGTPRAKTRALCAAIQEELPARWVREAIADVQKQAGEGATPETRRRARALLKKINTAQNAVGKGNTEHLPPEEKPKSKRGAVSRAKAIARLVSNYKRAMKKYGNHEEALRATEAKFRESQHIRDPDKKSLILQGFHRRIEAL